MDLDQAPSDALEQLVASGGGASDTVAAWLSDPDACARVADAGHTVVETLGGALDRTLASLNPYLMQLQLRQRARHA